MIPAARAWGGAAGVAAASAASRLLGLLREVLFAALLGAGPATDAFVTAFRIPGAARDLFAEGALSAGLVPAFAEEAESRGPEATAPLLGAALGAVLLLSGAAAALLALFAPQVTGLLAPAFPPEVAALTTRLSRVMVPLVVLVALSGVVMAALHGHGRLIAPALAPASFNVGAVAVGLALWIAGAGPRRAALGWALGTLLGGVLQLGVQLPTAGRLRLRVVPALGSAAWAHPGLRRIARAAGPAVVGLAAVQVNLLVGNAFAAREPRAVSWLAYAFPLVQLPLGIFGLAVASSAGAGLARSAAIRDAVGAERTLSGALRNVAFFAVPAAVGLAVLAEPIAGLLYRRGAFTQGDVSATARALAAYAIGLPALGAVRVMAPAFYAFHGARVPALASLATIAAHLGLTLVLQPLMGFQGVALSCSLAALLQLALLRSAWRGRHRTPDDAGQAWHLARVLLASAAMGAVAWLGWRGVSALWPSGGLPRQLTLALAPITLAGAAYLAGAHLLGVNEVAALLSSSRTALAGGRPARAISSRRPPA